MRKSISYILLILWLVVVVSCVNEESKVALENSKIELWGEEIQLNGNPAPELVAELEKGNVDYVFSFSNMLHLSIIIEPPYIYHCFIIEQVLDNKQLSYLKIDDAARLHFVPQYDSLKYDLNFKFDDVKNGLFFSSKFDSVPLFRAKSEKYNQLLTSCDDDKDFSDYYKKSLYFNSDTIINSYDRDSHLKKLMEVLLVRLAVLPVFDDYPILDCIFLNSDLFLCGGPTGRFFPDYSNDNPAELLKDYISRWNEGYNAGSYISRYDGRRYDTKIFSYNKGLINNLETKTHEIDSLFKSGWYIYNYHDIYYFAFSVDSINIKRKFINANYLKSSRFGIE